MDRALDLASPPAAGSLVGVLGAGFMGTGIAASALARGYRVRLFDIRPEALGRAVASCRRQLASGAPAPAAEIAIQRLLPTLALNGLARAGVVVEAIVEEEGPKRELLALVEPWVPADSLLASNTSTIPIAKLAAGLARPERVLGLHFFSPVQRMPLVEIVRHAGTAPWAIERAQAFVRSLGKTPIVVADGPGFYTSRILSPYLGQALALLAEGWDIPAVDAAARALGFPVGPLELLDEVGIDIAAHAARTMAEAYPERMPQARAWRQLLEAGRFGRKRGQGFYDYKRSRKRPDAELREVLGIRRTARGKALEENSERLLWAMVAEALRCLEDGTLANASDGDLGACLGLGFPPRLGGPFRLVSQRGPAAVRDRLVALERAHGPAFAPPAILDSWPTEPAPAARGLNQA